ncbi:unnamed protein product [Prorocentrum cordatum]|uniref:H(+)-exporting diphosphatase n=1 Tax=Prorocentrum cordatum TaxID=2364126 RepID=A0ABN9W3W0_9DINO|nr:unnamed protein product [Polarella glacialis]
MKIGSGRPVTDRVEQSSTDFRVMLIAPSTCMPGAPAGTADAGRFAAKTSALSTPTASNSDVGRPTSTPVAAFTSGSGIRPSMASLTLALVTVSSIPSIVVVMLDKFDAISWKATVSSAFAMSASVAIPGMATTGIVIIGAAVITNSSLQSAAAIALSVWTLISVAAPASVE